MQLYAKTPQVASTPPFKAPPSHPRTLFLHYKSANFKKGKIYITNFLHKKYMSERSYFMKLSSYRGYLA